MNTNNNDKSRLICLVHQMILHKIIGFMKSNLLCKSRIESCVFDGKDISSIFLSNVVVLVISETNEICYRV